MKRIFTKLEGIIRRVSASLSNAFRTFIHIFSAAAFIAVFLLSPLATQAQSVNASQWKGEIDVQSHQSIRMKPGSDITFEIHFKNTGKKTWKNTGANFVALATTDPEKRDSVFRHRYWQEISYRPAFLKQSEVKPGEIGIFRFPLQAPEKEGDYVETFQAVAKNAAWIEGTKFSLPITVTKNPSQELPKKEEPVQQTTQTNTETQKTETNISKDASYTVTEDYPIRDKTYAAEWVGGQKVEIKAIGGTTVTQQLQVKNIGSKTWNSTGNRFVSAYTVRPNYHESQFYTENTSWKDKTQILMKSPSVAPGEIGEFELSFSIPTVHATYDEQIRLAAENYSWMKGGELHLQIHSQPKEQPRITLPERKGEEKQEETATIYRDTSYAAQFMISGGSLELEPGETTSYRIGFKNVGQTTWQSSGNRFVSLYTIDPNYRASRFASTRVAALNDGWISKYQIQMEQQKVAPGQLAFFDFDLTAPTTPGDYTEKFRLAAEDFTWIQGGEINIDISVKKTTALPVISQPGNTGSANLGPIMRVGVIHAETTHSITADTPFEVRTGSGQLLVSLPAKTAVNITYNKTSGQYTVQSAVFNTTIDDYIVVQALDNFTIMELLSLERRLPWNPAVNENLFRGSLEIRHSQATGRTWVINILPMEQYLKGIAETSSESPVEFLKVMSVAARTYATYHYERQTKHADEHFYVDSEFDQVYKGYALEKRHPRLVEAVDATTGQVVTWTDPQTGETKIAITPYFSSSDGRTRDWSEVWGGEVPWAKSVPVPHDIGKQLLGHGVGMSARGGLLMVVEDNATYDEVLKYFFQGIQIQDRY